MVRWFLTKYIRDFLNCFFKFFAGMNALMYANTMNSLVPAQYNPYIWHPIPGLFLPYHPNKIELSPEGSTSLDRSFTPEKAKIGECE